ILVDLEPETDAAAAVRLLVESGAEVSSVETARESLEDIFLKLVEEEEAQAEAEAETPAGETGS
ncbi:MAG: hypothetical protein WBP17_12830, partial [Gemmatimonadota bacterium]